MNQDSFFSNPENERLRKYIAKLPDLDQVVINLFYFGDLSAREIGAVIGKKRLATLKIVERAREKLRQMMEE